MNGMTKRCARCRMRGYEHIKVEGFVAQTGEFYPYRPVFFYVCPTAGFLAPEDAG